MKQGVCRRAGRNEAEMEPAEMQSYRHDCRGVADPNADICAEPNQPGTGDCAAYIFNRVNFNLISSFLFKISGFGYKIQGN